jgi:hypothetical protein
MSVWGVSHNPRLFKFFFKNATQKFPKKYFKKLSPTPKILLDNPPIPRYDSVMNRRNPYAYEGTLRD